MLIGKKRTAAKLFILTLAHKIGEEGITQDFILEKLKTHFNENPRLSISMILNGFLDSGFFESNKETFNERYTITDLGKLHRISLIKLLEEKPHDRGDGTGGGVVSPTR